MEKFSHPSYIKLSDSEGMRPSETIDEEKALAQLRKDAIGRKYNKLSLSRPVIVRTVMFLFFVILLNLLLFVLIPFLLHRDKDSDASNTLHRRWGGYSTRPQSNKCYRQERTAMLLSIFLGVLGVDQFYAGHWVLAAFKLLTGGGLGLWALVDTVLWIVGGVYGTRGCGGTWRY